MDFELFQDLNGKIITDTHYIEQPMPTQMNAGSAETITIENLGIVIGGSMAASVSSSFVMNILLKASLNSLIQTIKILILIAHLPLLAVFIPANAYLFFSILQQIL